ncbi:hypothetical protein FRB97_002914 [Tulasnella sp. 331]|nr:hypothetical protein FRB97_002914 [Tulasnella sp. 331]
MLGMKATGNKRHSLFSSSAVSPSASPFQSSSVATSANPLDDHPGPSSSSKSIRSTSFSLSSSFKRRNKQPPPSQNLFLSITPAAASSSSNDHSSSHRTISPSLPHTASIAGETLENDDDEKEKEDDETLPLRPRPPSRSPIPRRFSQADMYTTMPSRGTTGSGFLRTHIERDDFAFDFNNNDEEKRGRSYTSELSDFLRDTGPEMAPPILPSFPPPSESGSSGVAGGLFGKFLKKKEKRSSRSINGSSQREGRRMTASSFSSATSVAALNKALHHIPPPNTEPKVFANGQTIYMINRPTTNDPGKSSNLNVPQPQPRNVSNGSGTTRQSLSSSSSSSVITYNTTPINNLPSPSATDHRRGSLKTIYTNESYISNTSATAIMTAAVIPSLSPTRERIVSGERRASMTAALLDVSKAGKKSMGGEDVGKSSDIETDVGYKLGDSSGGGGSGMSPAEMDTSDVDPAHSRRRATKSKQSSLGRSASGSPKRRQRQRSGSLNLQNTSGTTTLPLVIRQPGSTSATSTLRMVDKSPSVGSHHSYSHFHSAMNGGDNDTVDKDWVSPESPSAPPQVRVTRVYSLPQNAPSSAHSYSTARSASDSGVPGVKVAEEDEDDAVVVVRGFVKKRASDLPSRSKGASLLPQDVEGSTSLQSAKVLDAIQPTVLPLKSDYATYLAEKARSSTSYPTTSSKSVNSRRSSKAQHGSGSRPSASSIPSPALVSPLVKGLETPPQTSNVERFFTPTSSPLQTIPQEEPERTKTPPIEFRGYMFPQPPLASSPPGTAKGGDDASVDPLTIVEPKNEELSSTDEDSDRRGGAVLGPSRSNESMVLNRQIVDVLEMSKTYGALAEEGKEKQGKEKETDTPRASSHQSSQQQVATKAPASRTHFGHSSTAARMSVSSSKSTSWMSVPAPGPPRLPLPPSPIIIGSGSSTTPTVRNPSPILNGGLASAFGSPTLPPSSSPVFTSASTPQAQITSLTYALHTQRNRYETLSTEMTNLRAGFEKERATYDAKIAELLSRDEEREKEMKEMKEQLIEYFNLAEAQKQRQLLQENKSRHLSYEQHHSRKQTFGLGEEERAEYDRRMEEFERQLDERDARIVALEEARYRWERERKGLRWLVGRVGPGVEVEGDHDDGSRVAAGLTTIGPSDSEMTAISVRDEGVQTEVSHLLTKRPGFKRSVTLPATLELTGEMTASIVPVNVISNSPDNSRPKSILVSISQPSDQKLVTPLLDAFAVSRPLSTEPVSRTSLDEQLLHGRRHRPEGPPSRESLSVRRHSVHVESPTTASMGGWRFSAALDDMLQKLRSLSVDHKGGSALSHNDSDIQASFSLLRMSSDSTTQPTPSTPRPTIVRSTSIDIEEMDAAIA